LRIRLRDASRARLDGVWWPQSRNLQAEAADLIDNFPSGEEGRVYRLLYSRPDWDDSVVEGRGIRSVQARRGAVKVGSFPSDDTHLMILTMATGRRLRLLVVPSSTEPDEAHRQLRAAGKDGRMTGDADWASWDDVPN
jgi:hypothetical protein